MSLLKTMAVFLIAGILTGCATVETDWNKATQKNTKYAYRSFLREHPKSQFTKEARNRIEAIDWQRAKAKNSPKSYQTYLKMYPNGQHAKDAKLQIQRLAWNRVKANDTIEMYKKFLSKYPNSPYEKKAKERIEKLSEPIKFDSHIPVRTNLAILEFHSEQDLKAVKTRSKVRLSQPKNSDLVKFDGSIEYDHRMRSMIWNPGAIHTIIGKVKIKAFKNVFIFESDPVNPLVFQLDRKQGYVFMNGRGIITYPDGKKIQVEKIIHGQKKGVGPN